ncbi:family 1 glycosylhydrolase [Nakamurella lactea]|uniref:family 1 glycosylhydrolase n=1 Tax=Nakamurella lactea TaxID=459515 RepID=UPI000401AD70|nr:family 1 glycosylhydrolase [Nakamurella lactea]
MSSPLPVPPDFLFGVSSSAAAIEGGSPGDGRTASVWDVFAAAPGRIADGAGPDVAAGHYQRMRTDVGLLAELGVDAYRFSVSWSRVQPGGTGPANPAGLDFYDRLLDELAGVGIAPWLTLYHWDLPLELMLDGGWLDRDTAGRFADYAALVAEKFGDRVAAWITMDDAALHSFYGHAVGIDAPGLTLFGGAFAVTHHLLLGHAAALTALRAATAAPVGIVNHHSMVDPATDSTDDRAAAQLYDTIHNRQFSDPVLIGAYPEGLAALPGTDLSVVADGDLAAIGAPIDFYGVSYDHPRWVAAAPDNRSVPFTMVERDDRPHSAAGTAVQPAALTRVLTELAGRQPGVVLYAETGAAHPGPADGTSATPDRDRTGFLVDHLQAALAARAAGAQVRGWFWSHLLDGWDYGDGFSRPRGLVRVDRDTLERVPRAAFRRFAELIAAARA